MAEQADEATAREALRAWYAKNAERTLGRQQSQVDNAKILVGLTLAVATTLVATALQVDPARALDTWASILLGFCFIASVAVIFMDRLKEPDSTFAEKRARMRGAGWTDAQLLEFLEEVTVRAEQEGEKVARWVRCAAQIQIAVVVATCTTSVVSLLGK